MLGHELVSALLLLPGAKDTTLSADCISLVARVVEILKSQGELEAPFRAG